MGYAIDVILYESSMAILVAGMLAYGRVIVLCVYYNV